MAPLYRDLHRSLRPRARHVRKQLSARQGPVQLSGDLQRLQASRRAIQRGREDRVVLQDRGGFLQAQAWIIRGRQCRPLRAAAILEATMKPRIFWLKILGCLAIFPAISNFAATPAGAATVVALGASNTYGKGVARDQAYPAQLEAM